MNNDFINVREEFVSLHGKECNETFISYGRLELLGNHTDHNHGEVLVSAASLGIKAATSSREDGIIDILSIGYGRFSLSIKDLAVKEEEKGTPIALTRGVLSGLLRSGHQIKGFSGVFESNIFPGAGVSSSAAYELLIAEIENYYANEGKIDRLLLAQIGQFSENVYFGKPSGLLDQCGSSFGGVSYIDFSDINNPKVENVLFPKEWKLHIILTNPGKGHGHLTNLYAAIPQDMKKAAAAFGKEFLGEVDPKVFYQNAYNPKLNISDISRTRAIHFFSENERVKRAIEAIKSLNREAFLEIIRSSENSSAYLLKNAMVPGTYKGSPLEAVERGLPFLKVGAGRLMGGGFAGTSISFVPDEEVEAFYKAMVSFYGEKAVVEVSIPEQGAHLVS